MTSSKTLSIRSTIEPINGLKIDLTAKHTYNQNADSYINKVGNNYEYNNKIITGDFSMTFNTWNTAFQSGGTDENNHYSKAFEDFKSNRIEIANQLAEQRRGINGYNPDINRDSLGFPDGYGNLSQDVIMPAFIAAYSGTKTSTSMLSKIPTIWQMRPNWRISYDGLNNLNFIKNYFKKVMVNHSYTSSYNINSFTSDTRFVVIPGNDGYSEIRDELNNYNFVPEYEIGAISISEAFSPLIDIDMTWKNSFSTRIELKKNRNLTYSFSNNQLT
jgi:cell surface protein SprA